MRDDGAHDLYASMYIPHNLGFIRLGSLQRGRKKTLRTTEHVEIAGICENV